MYPILTIVSADSTGRITTMGIEMSPSEAIDKVATSLAAVQARSGSSPKRKSSASQGMSIQEFSTGATPQAPVVATTAASPGNTSGTTNGKRHTPTAMVVADAIPKPPTGGVGTGQLPGTKTSSSNSPAAPQRAKSTSKRKTPPLYNLDSSEDESKRQRITVEQIEESIPEDASSVFHIYGRRVNFDMHKKDASMYSLLRSWVQDDPFRKVPAPGSDPTQMYRVPAPVRRVSSRKDDELHSEPTQVDVIRQLTTTSVKRAPTLEELRNNLVGRAKSIRQRCVSDFRRRDLETVANLRARGIRLPHKK